MPRVRTAARDEASASAAAPPVSSGATFNASAYEMIGPRGGLPRNKPDMERLVKSFGIRTEGMTLDKLRQP
eukprot:5876309-Heterocapsa_arctica.AAC.1